MVPVAGESGGSRRAHRAAAVVALGLCLAAAVCVAISSGGGSAGPVALAGWGNLMDIMSGKAKVPGEPAKGSKSATAKSSALRRLAAKIPVQFQKAMVVRAQPASIQLVWFWVRWRVPSWALCSLASTRRTVPDFAVIQVAVNAV
jgi:hypothetical protein